MKKTRYLCPQCHKALRGYTRGPRVECRLFCTRCRWVGNTDDLRKINRAQHEEFLRDPGVQAKLATLPPTEFVGYDTLSCTSEILACWVRK